MTAVFLVFIRIQTQEMEEIHIRMELDIIVNSTVISAICKKWMI